MLLIPFPFAIAIVLLALFVVVVIGDNDRPPNMPFLALIALSAFQSILLGLRWGYGVAFVTYVTPVVAATIPPLVYAGVSQLVKRSTLPPHLRVAAHALPALLVLVLVVTWRDGIDVVLFLIFVGYAIAILRLMRPGVNALRRAALDEARSTYHAVLFAAGTLLLSAMLDVCVSFDLVWMHGQHAAILIAGGNAAALIILSVAGAIASRGRVSRETQETARAPKAAADPETMASIERLMVEKRLYHDCDLTLNRLSRKAGISARQISEAINRATGKNVSQYVNDFRIAEACRLLTETDKSVTEIMYMIGFQTKSNFNREFRRVTGLAPSEWRLKTASTH